MYPNLMDTNNVVLRKKFIALREYIKKAEKALTSNLTAHLKALEQKEADSSRWSRREEIIKLWAEIKKLRTKKTIPRINETNSLFFEKISKTDKPLSKLIKRQRKNIQINKIRNEKGVIITGTEELQIIIRSYSKPCTWQN